MENTETLLVDAEQLAHLLSVDKRWVQAHAKRIVGNQKIGRLRRYNLAVIKKRLALGQDILN